MPASGFYIRLSEDGVCRYAHTRHQITNLIATQTQCEYMYQHTSNYIQVHIPARSVPGALQRKKADSCARTHGYIPIIQNNSRHTPTRIPPPQQSVYNTESLIVCPYHLYQSETSHDDTHSTSNSVTAVSARCNAEGDCVRNSAYSTERRFRFHVAFRVYLI
jgi:hypothetical protein